MGNAVRLHCKNLCCQNIPNNILITNIEQKYFAIPTENGQNSEYLSNSFIKENKFLHKSFQHFFTRETQTVNNFQFVITPKKIDNKKNKNIYLTNNLQSTIKENSEIHKQKENNLQKIKQNNKNNNFYLSIDLSPTIKDNDEIDKEKEIDLNIYKSKINSIILNSENKESCIIDKNHKIDNLLKVHKTTILKNNSHKIKKLTHSISEIEVHHLANNKKIKKELLLNKDNINPNEEEENNNTNHHLNVNRGRKNSVCSIFSNFGNTIISTFPKGDFLYKNINYEYLGKKDENKNKTGFGIITYEDKTKLKGIFKNDKLNGFGKFIDLHSIYTGYYKDSIPNGFGIYKKDNVTTIGDNWIKNNLNGVGYQMFGLNDFYEGEFNKSVKQGIGLYHWNDNTICFGEWNDDKVNGYGVIKYANNNTYMGEFKENEMDGWGEFIWNDNKYYCGEYKDGFKHGFGIYVTDFKKINCYIGFWEYGQASGLGIKINDNDMIIGIWRDGKRINYIKYWEIKDYLKPNQTKFFKFLHRDVKFFKQYILNLKKNDLFNCQIHIVEDFSV